MSLANPGKTGFLTVLALIIVIGIPGMIAYADDSTDTYYSSTDVTAPEKVRVIGSSSDYFGVSSVLDDGSYSVIIDDTSITTSATALSSITSVTKLQVMLESAEFEATASKICFSSDLEATAVSFAFFDSSVNQIEALEMECSDSGVWECEVSSTDALALTDATSVRFILTLDGESDASDIQTFSCSYDILIPETIFTDDVVELLVLVGGIVLLIIGTFALSFIDVGSPGKMIKSAGRGIRSAGRKINRRSR